MRYAIYKTALNWRDPVMLVAVRKTYEGAVQWITDHRFDADHYVMQFFDWEE